jgi:hypothetical protein
MARAFLGSMGLKTTIASFPIADLLMRSLRKSSRVMK